MHNKDAKEKQGGVIGFIGKGMLIEGKLSFEHTVRIDGGFIGEISSTGENGTLVVGGGAELQAEIKVDTAVVMGNVKGKVEAKTRVELQSPARVSGEIRTPNLIIGEGALFEGNCVMVKKDKTSETIAYEGTEMPGEPKELH